jgi:hypothetical protein
VTNILESEPVRTKVYPLLVLVVGYLLTKGILDGATVDFILAGMATLVGVGGIESARGSVWSPESVAKAGLTPGSK